MSRRPGLFRSVRHKLRRFVRHRYVNEFVIVIELRKLKRLKFESDIELVDFEPSHRELINTLHERSGVDASQRSRVEYYMDRGHNGRLAFVDGDLIGYIWWTDDSLSEARAHPHVRVYDVPLGARGVYMTDFYINPEQRGSGRALALLNLALHDVKNRGYNRVYGVLAAHKTAVKWVYTSLGFKILRPQRGHIVFGKIAFSNGRIFDAQKSMF